MGEGIHKCRPGQYSFSCILGCAWWVVRVVAQRPEVNPQQLCFLVQVAALEAERLGGIGDMKVMALQFGPNDLPLKALGAFG